MPPPVQEDPQVPCCFLLGNPCEEMDSKRHNSEVDVSVKRSVVAYRQDTEAIDRSAVPVDAMDWMSSPDKDVVGQDAQGGLEEPEKLPELCHSVVGEGREHEKYPGQATPPVKAVLPRQVLRKHGKELVRVDLPSPRPRSPSPSPSPSPNPGGVNAELTARLNPADMPCICSRNTSTNFEAK